MPDLSDAVNWSEVDADNNNASPNGWPEGMMPSGVNDAARADRGALKRFWNKINPVQVIAPVGVVWKFVTDDPGYPAAYVDGEVYCFRNATGALGGDQFQVNLLLPKPIWKHLTLGPAGFVPIIAHDFSADNVQLVFDASLNAGTGAFILLNPFVPIGGDGAGGVRVPGALAVNGQLSASSMLIGSLSASSILSSGDITSGGNLHQNGAYHYFAGSSGVINAAGGPLIYGDVNVIVVKPGNGTGGFVVENYAGSQVFGVDNSGNMTIAGSEAVTGALTVTGATHSLGSSFVTGGLTVGGTVGFTSGLDIAGLVPGQPYSLIVNGPTYTGTVAVSGQLSANQGINVTGVNPGQPYTLIVNGPTYTGPVTVAGDVVVGAGEGIAVGGVGSIANSVNVAGNYYRGGVAIPVLTEAWMTQYDELVARVAAIEAALTART